MITYFKWEIFLPPVFSSFQSTASQNRFALQVLVHSDVTDPSKSVAEGLCSWVWFSSHT